MGYLIFKTDIESKRKVHALRSVFNHHRNINDWSIDMEDIDNVLRVASEELTERDVIDLVNKCGFYCEVLPD